MQIKIKDHLVLLNNLCNNMCFMSIDLFVSEGGKKRSSVQRSEEVRTDMVGLSNRISKQASKESTDGSIGSISSDSGSV